MDGRAVAKVTAGAVLPVAVAVGVYLFGREHTPNYNTSLFGQTGDAGKHLKAQMATGLLALALVQVGLALWMYGRLPRVEPAPHRVRTGHRVIGLLAFLLSLPIAAHCLVTYGVQFYTTRVAVHSITGCVLYGAFVAKVVVVRSPRLPGFALPIAGGVLAAAIGLMWYVAALWQFNGLSVPGF
ncbi:DUF6529 family protein [Streptomyces sp. NPDC058045]|uniref:DUF6529 family protein n=1 Tax=Streptomyces sp. NPDC058045 TaxID=3346311 RepID=UPI0036EF083D